LGSSEFECHAVKEFNSIIHIDSYQIVTQSPQIPGGDYCKTYVKKTQKLAW
jgi:hypothetical protein